MNISNFDQKIKQIINENSGKGEIRVDCFCEGNQKDTLSVNTETGVYNCFRCGAKGNALKSGYSDNSEKSAQKKAKYMLDNSYNVNGFAYLEKKQIKACEGVKGYTDKGGNKMILIPVLNKEGILKGIQKIYENGDKRFVKGTEKNGGFFRINGNENGKVCLSEGYATGYSIYEATGNTVYVTFDAGNISHVLDSIHKDYSEIVICADNDHKAEDNPGKNKAIKAALKYDNVKIVYPVGIQGSDFNDMMIEKGLDAVKESLSQAKRPDKSELPKKTENQNYDLINNAVKELNQKHAVIMIGGKCLIMNEIIDPVFDRPDITFSNVSDFKNFYSNQFIENEESEKKLSLASLWLKSKNRRQYKALTFDPSKEPGDTKEGFYNLWRGLDIKPKKGKWEYFENHLHEVIADGDEKIFHWVKSWVARIVQCPGGERPGTAIVLRGKQGTGKDAFAQWIGRLFGVHFLHIANQKQLTGKFNNHLKNALLVFCDEGFWAGDKAAAGVLKSMITDPFVMIEPKGKDAFSVKNHINLIMASNEKWVVPAGLEERRFAVLDVSDIFRNNHDYFDKLHKEMNNGGLQAMLYDLLEYDISGVNLREIPKTPALLEQKINSMSVIQKYWYSKITEGDEAFFEKWHSTQDLYNDFILFCEKIGHKSYRPIDADFFKQLKQVCDIQQSRVKNAMGIRERGYHVPCLHDCREFFKKCLEMEIDFS